MSRPRFAWEMPRAVPVTRRSRAITSSLFVRVRLRQRSSGYAVSYRTEDVVVSGKAFAVYGDRSGVQSSLHGRAESYADFLRAT